MVSFASLTRAEGDLEPRPRPVEPDGSSGQRVRGFIPHARRGRARLRQRPVQGTGGRTRADTFDEEAVTRVEGRKRVDTQNIELHDVVRMAQHFGVSCTAMLYRLKGLDFVTEDERSSLAAQDSAGLAKALRGFPGLREPVDSDGEMRVHARFVAMAIGAFTRGKIAQRKLDELGSLVQVSDLSQRLRQAGFGMGLGEAACLAVDPVAGSEDPG